MSYRERMKTCRDQKEKLEYQASLWLSLQETEAGEWLLETLQRLRDDATDCLIQGKSPESDAESRGLIRAVDTLLHRLRQPAMLLNSMEKREREERALNSPLEGTPWQGETPGAV